VDGPDLSALFAALVEVCLQFLHLFDEAQKFFAEVGESIFHARGNFRELFPLEKARSGEVAQSVAEHLGADPFDVALDGAGTIHTARHGAQHGKRPATADDILEQRVHPARAEFGHEGQKFFVAVSHKFTPKSK